MSTNKIEVQDTKEFWVAWTSTDLTEGRGWRYPYAITETPETATRLGRRKYVQGTDCPITRERAVKVEGQWLVPGRIHTESRDDELLRKQREAREAAIERARAAGLSEEDLAIISGERK